VNLTTTTEVVDSSNGTEQATSVAVGSKVVALALREGLHYNVRLDMGLRKTEINVMTLGSGHSRSR
jgi:hypothetical protein